MTRSFIEPGAMLGVLGGGQLGAMFASAARRLGYRVAVWDSDPDAPALRSADLPVTASFEDEQGLARFAGSIRAATYEWENIPGRLAATLEQRVPLRPSAKILGSVQHRVAQKTFLADHGFPVAPFHAAPSLQELTVPTEIGYPVLCKTATSGYDGKGQWRVTGPADLAGLRSGMNRAAPGGWILERFLAFEKELSVLVVRGLDGDCRAYPVSENLHEAGILRISRIPAAIEPRLADEAMRLARAVVEAFEGVGVFCVELFLMPDGRLYINEIAPRPHNSGHYTLDACTVSQFEQQVRALCGLPLGEARLLCPAVMVNLIGEDLTLALSEETLRDLLRTAGAKLHIYGKKVTRLGRKMGHVTFLAEKGETAWGTALAFHQALSLPGGFAAGEPTGLPSVAL